MDQIRRQQSEGRSSACILCSLENGTPIFKELKQANTRFAPTHTAFQKNK